MELKILFVLHLLLKPFMLGNRLKQKKNVGRVGEQEWLGNALIHTARANMHEVEGKERNSRQWN